MSGKERRWMVELKLVLEGKQSLKDVQAKVGGSYRTVRRRLKRLRERGDAGLCHANRGQPSNRSKPPETREAVLGLYREKLSGWGPTLAAEKALEWGHRVDHETLRRWLMSEGLWQRQRERLAHRKRRERRAHFGELVQIDGSFHLWLPKDDRHLCLMVMVDDATGRKLARFFEQETTRAALEILGQWIRLYGIPCALYADGKSVYVLDDEAGHRARERGEEPLTQFGRACAGLGVRIIRARSPQAKGRVERANGLLQDRLVKELALRGITTVEEANAFLDGGYLASLNEKFAKLPASEVDYHRPTPEEQELKAALTIEETRTVANDWTVRNKNRVYQILGPKTHLPPAKGTVVLQQRLDGSLHILYRGAEVVFEEITGRPKEQAKPTQKGRPRRIRRQTPWTPPPDHPWRGRFAAPAVPGGGAP